MDTNEVSLNSNSYLQTYFGLQKLEKGESNIYTQNLDNDLLKRIDSHIQGKQLHLEDVDLNFDKKKKSDIHIEDARITNSFNKQKQTSQKDNGIKPSKRTTYPKNYQKGIRKEFENNKSESEDDDEKLEVITI